MGEKKNRFLFIGIIVAIVYSVIAFAVPFVKLPTFFVGYIFGLVAITVMTLVYMKYEGKKEIKSKFLGWSIVDVVVKYAIVQIIVSLFFMALSMMPVWIPWVVCIVLLAFVGVVLIAADSAVEEIEQIGKQIKEKVFYIQELKTDVEVIVDKTEDILLRKKLNELAEQIRFSDPMSAEQLSTVERKIQEKVYLIREAVEVARVDEASALCDEVKTLLVERNKKCLLLK